MSNEYENLQQLSYPKLYPNENDIIPYSPRKQFRFMDSNNPLDDKTIKLESMQNMSIDQIIGLYKNGFTIEDSSPSQIMTASNDITVSSDAILLIGIGIFAYMMLKRK